MNAKKILRVGVSLLLAASGGLQLSSGFSFLGFLLKSAAEKGLLDNPADGFSIFLGVSFSAAPAILVLGGISLLASYMIWLGKKNGLLIGAVASALGMVGALHFAPLKEVAPLLITLDSLALAFIIVLRKRFT